MNAVDGDLLPLLPVESIRSVQRDKKLYKALLVLTVRVSAAIVQYIPSDLLLYLYLTGVSHGAEIERRNTRRVEVE